MSYKNIKNSTKACGCQLYFHVKRSLTYFRRKRTCFTEKKPTTPFTLLTLDGVFLMGSEETLADSSDTVEVKWVRLRFRAMNLEKDLYLFINTVAYFCNFSMDSLFVKRCI